MLKYWSCCLQMYLEAVLDGFNAVRSRPHVSRMAMFRVCSEALVPFLACHFRESCIASPDMREMLLQTISILLQSKSFVARFEASSEARAHLVCPALTLHLWNGSCITCLFHPPSPTPKCPLPCGEMFDGLVPWLPPPFFSTRGVSL